MRARALLRWYVDRETRALAEPVPVDDHTLLLTAAQDAIRLSLMGEGLLVLTTDELDAIIGRP